MEECFVTFMIKGAMLIWGAAVALSAAPFAGADEATIEVHGGQVLHRVSRYLTGACLEDVNHEVYGGIDSQMIFGESFQEPPRTTPFQQFSTFGGNWTATRAAVQVTGGDGPKIVSTGPAFGDGVASVDVFFDGADGGNAGLIVHVTQAAPGRDEFNGYEISLEPSGHLVLGRHRQNWEALRRVDCPVPLNTWITLAVQTTGKSLTVQVNHQTVLEYAEAAEALPSGPVGLRAWQRAARFRNLSVSVDGVTHPLTFEPAAGQEGVTGVSGMWQGFRRGTAKGGYAIETNQPFLGQQSQRLTLAGGSGSLGVENQGLNRWGMNWQAGKVYEGYLWVRAEPGLTLSVALESRDGAVAYAETPLTVTTNGWQRLNFNLTPTATDAAGRFAIELKQPGTVDLGYALIQPGDWGRFKGLPVRKDVGEGLVNQGVTVVRYGGCMANAAGYRWKNMIGPRDRRPPYVGWWYPHSSNGWGIPDFLNFCEAAGFVGIPDVNVNESPQDLADLVDYLNGPADSEWGQRRVADGHPVPYRVGWLELGNEEKVNEDYWRKFEPLAKAIWARDPAIILVVGDFSYHQPLPNPFDFHGADGGITNLAVQQKILRLAKANGREVWFDIHLNTDGPQPEWGGVITYIDALDRLAEGARHRVVIFELNAGIHSQRRALANALAINALERDGRVPIITSANALQPDGQNDNDWNQGLLFLNPTQTWLQPPGYVTQMISSHYQPRLVKADVSPATGSLDVTATLSEDGRTLVLQVVNIGDQPESTELSVDGFAPAKPTAQVEELAADPAAVNTARQPEQVKPQNSVWTHSLKDGQGRAQYTFKPHSFTVMEFE